MSVLDDFEGWVAGKPPARPAQGLAVAATSAQAATPVPAAFTEMRGIRNNNPGNIDRDGTAWQGLAADQSSDPRFCVFVDAQHGIRALALVLLTYQEVHDLDTIRGVISRWAPAVENDTEAYISAVTGRTGIGADTVIDLRHLPVARLVVAAIIAQENADYAYPPEVLDAGLTLAGVAA